MILREVRNQHRLSNQQVADLLGYTTSTAENYCSADVIKSQSAAVNLDNIIKSAYDVAVDVLGDATVRDVAIRQVAKQIIMRNFRLGTEAFRVFEILARMK